MLFPELSEFKKCSLGRTPAFLTEAQEKDLWQQWQAHQNPHARDSILEAHLPLCRALSMEYARKSKVPVQDLFGEAMLEMLERFEKFDPHHDSRSRFCAYIEKPIRGKLSVYVMDMISPVKLVATKGQRMMFRHWGKMNADILNSDPYISTYGRHRAIAKVVATKYPEIEPDDVHKFEARLHSSHLSLNQPVSNEEGGNEFIDLMTGEINAPDILLQLRDQDSLVALMQAAKLSLMPREQDIINRRIYCEDDEKIGLKELAAEFGVSVQAVQQMESRALKKMRLFMESAGNRSTQSLTSESNKQTHSISTPA